MVDFTAHPYSDIWDCSAKENGNAEMQIRMEGYA